MGGRRRATRLLQVLCALPFLLTATPTSGADPTDQEQYFVWELNRARNDPEAWALEFGLDSRIGGDGLPTDLVGVDPQPPLAVNELLIDSAVFHSDEMANFVDPVTAIVGSIAWTAPSAAAATPAARGSAVNTTARDE